MGRCYSVVAVTYMTNMTFFDLPIHYSQFTIH